MVDRIEIEVGDSEVTSALSALSRQGQSLAPAMQQVGRSLEARIKMGFRGGVSPYGQSWAKPKMRDGQALRDTGRLNRSITYRASNYGVEVGTNVIYGPIHQFGGVIKAKNAPFLVFKTPTGFARVKSVTIPARPFMPIQGGNVKLPNSWSNSALDALKDHFNIGGTL